MLDGIPISTLTPPALLGIVVLLVILGRLVPWYIHKEKIKEAERWRLAYEAERDARVISDAQTVELLELAKTTHNIIVAMFGSHVGRHRQSGGTSVVPTTR